MNFRDIAELVAAILGGAGTKTFFDMLRSGRDKKLDEASEIRKELRASLAEIRVELQQVSDDLDVWKEKYYSLLGRYTELKAEHAALLLRVAELTEEVGRNARLDGHAPSAGS